MPARLPNPGDDTGTWGTILNEFLSVGHDSAGHIMADELKETKAAATASTIASSKNCIYIANYAVVGDGGGAHYKRVASQPSHTGYFQTVDGAYWEINEPKIKPGMFGTLPAFNRGWGTQADATTYLQNAVNTAALQKRYVEIDDSYYVNGLTLPSYGKLVQTVNRDSGGLVSKANSTLPALMLANADVINIHVENLYINGNSSNQTNTIAGFLIDHSTTSNSVQLRRHYVNNLHIHNTSGNGFDVSIFSRGCMFLNGTIYKAGGIGFNCSMSDSLASNWDIGQSGSHGFVWSGSAGKIMNIKSWGSGAYATGSTANGYLVQQGNALFTNCEAQESGGSGWNFFRSGTTLRDIVAINCSADSDNVGATGVSAVNIFNVQRCIFIMATGKFVSGLAGTPTAGVSISGNSIDNKLVISSFGQSSFAWSIGAGSEANYFENNGSKGKWQAASGSTFTPNIYDSEGFKYSASGNFTIANPLRKNDGWRLRIAILQDATGNRVASWGADFKVHTPLDLTPSSITYYEFISDGTSWNDVNAVGKVLLNAGALGQTLTTQQSGTTFTNEGATVRADFILPSAIAGYVYEFFVQDADGIRVTAASGDTIRLGTTASATAGRITSTEIGASVKLLSINATEWVALYYVGTWSFA